jgi:hypothetical protein
MRSRPLITGAVSLAAILLALGLSRDSPEEIYVAPEPNVEKAESEPQESSRLDEQDSQDFYKVRAMWNAGQESFIAEARDSCLDSMDLYLNATGEDYGDNFDRCDSLVRNSDGIREKSCVWDITNIMRMVRTEYGEDVPIRASTIRSICRKSTPVTEDALVLTRDVESWHNFKDEEGRNVASAQYNGDRGFAYTVLGRENGNNTLDGDDFLNITQVGIDGSMINIEVDANGVNGYTFAGGYSIPMAPMAAESMYRTFASTFSNALVNGQTTPSEVDLGSLDL